MAESDARATGKRRRLLKALGLLAVGLVVAGIDTALYVSPPEGDTISENIWSFTGAHPGWTWIIGVVCGHLFWPRSVKPKD